jgi:two-component system NtrC family sensor kinase
MGGEKILVIDDRRENLLFLANSVLRPAGYNVITAMDGKMGLDKALAERPDLIITDLKMPRMSGLEVMSALRKANVYIPVILTTFYGSEQAAIQAFRLGARDYIIKPYEVDEMLESVERALVEQRLRREALGMKEGVELSQQLEERVRQLHSLCGIGKALMAIHSVEEAMRVLVEAAIYVSGAKAGQLFLVNAGTRQLELRAVRSPLESRARCLRQAGADPISTQVAKTGQAVIGDRESEGGTKVPCLVVPLRASETVIGVLGVDGKPDQPFGDNDAYHLGILADFGAVAVANARKMERMAGESRGAGQVDEPAGSGATRSPLPDLAERIAEAEQLAQDLRDLSSAARVLADKLQAYTQNS